MSEEKQIEEMAKDLYAAEFWEFSEEIHDLELNREETAKNLFDKGYRKQSEGEWVRNDVGDKMCSYCNTLVNYMSKFCPNCGAKMKGGS